jgi:MarR family transcriptional regulator, transcriptional regulator for hemolysin
MALTPESSAGYMTNLAARLFAHVIDERLRPLGVSSGQLPVFFALARGGALTQKALAQAAAIEQPTMAATLSRMERDGLIRRRPDPNDGRSALIALTPAALKKAKAVEEAVQSGNAKALAGLDEATQRAFLETLAKIVRALAADADGNRTKK